MERLKEGMLRLTKGWDRSQIERLVRDVLFDVIDPVRLPGGAGPDRAASERGSAHLHRVVLAGGGRAAARPTLRRQRRDRHARAGRTTTAATRASSRSTPTASRRPRRSASSRYALGLTSPVRYAYSDSVTDVPMLAAVGNPVAVNPDKALRREAEERGWQMRDFRRPVRLRSRIATAVLRRKVSIGAAVGRGRGRRRRWLGRRCDHGLAPRRAPELARVTSTRCGDHGAGCTVAVGAGRHPRGEQNPRASHAAGGMPQDPGRVAAGSRSTCRRALDTCSSRSMSGADARR